MKRFVFLVLMIFLLMQSEVFAAALYAGYAKTPWGADLKSVSKTYPKGKMFKLGVQDVYKQIKPNREIKQRSFAFSANRLVAVSVTLNPEYVKKTGIDKLLDKQKKLYGEGVMDRTGAPHTVSYRWQDGKTRITFAYAPKSPEMTVLMYEKK
jgi:hypothetical protein